MSKCTCSNAWQCSPVMFIVLFWLGWISNPSWHTTRVPLRCSVTLTVAVDVMDVPVTTSVTLNWNGGSENTSSSLRWRRAREILRDGISHWCPREGTVHVKVTVSPGHSLSTLDCNWAPETKGETTLLHLHRTVQRSSYLSYVRSTRWELAVTVVTGWFTVPFWPSYYQIEIVSTHTK